LNPLHSEREGQTEKTTKASKAKEKDRSLGKTERREQEAAGSKGKGKRERRETKDVWGRRKKLTKIFRGRGSNVLHKLTNKRKGGD